MTAFVVGLMKDSVALASLFCNAQTVPVTGLTFSPSTSPEIEKTCSTAPLVLYRTIVLDPPAPVESAVLPYSTHTDPSPMVTESGLRASDRRAGRKEGLCDGGIGVSGRDSRHEQGCKR